MIVLLILFQILVLNNIQFSGYVNPYVYIMIILVLPSVTPAWLVLIISFLTGLTIDLFSGSPGMHASATLLAGFARPLCSEDYFPARRLRIRIKSLDGRLRLQVVHYLCLSYRSDSPYNPFLS